MPSRRRSRRNGRAVKGYTYVPPDDDDLNTVALSFCENSSIRGVSRLAKRNSTVSLRLLWVFFLVTMTAILAYGSIVLIVEYLSYHTLINTRENHGETANFPSLTYCNHHPFSGEAGRLWAKPGGVTSPREFSASIRGMMKEAIRARRLDQARDLFFNDKMTAYFETLGPVNASRISHTKKALLYCLLQLKNSVLVGHAEDCGIQPTTFLHPKYINCQTIRVKESLSPNVVALGLIVNLDANPDYFNFEMGLVQDVFNQAQGTRVTLHEPGTYPDPVKDGVNIEAGKYTEMKFETVKWNMADSRREACMDHHTVTTLAPYRVNGEFYNYTSEICQQNQYAQSVFQECNCYSALYPSDDRQRQPEASFCTKVDPLDANDTLRRLRCFGGLKISELKLDPEVMCPKRCSYYTYTVHSSTSRWIPTDWQLYWLMSLNDAWGNLEKPAGEIDSKTYDESMHAINTFLKMENLTHVEGNKMNPERNVFFVVTRTSFITTEKVETLSLTASALLSRIGGLSSLSLGVTFATIFELIEFLCIFRKRRNWQQYSTQEVIYLNSHTSGEAV